MKPTRMVFWLALAGGAFLLTGCMASRLSVAKDLAQEARAYSATPAHPTRTLLVVGDSTAVGTGAATPAESMVGLIGQAHPDWRIDNRAVNGARFADVVAQLQAAPPGYDLVLVLAGGNDVIRFTGQEALRSQLEQTATLAQQRGRAVVLMPPGNVGHAPFFLPPVSWLMGEGSQRLHAMVQEVAAAHKVRYVRLLKPKASDPFVAQSGTLHAADGLHPSSAGYQQWLDELVQQGGLAPN